MLEAFHGKQAIKDKYIARVRVHRETDRLVRGTGYENGRGCAVGCTLDRYEHAAYEAELGIPEWLARVEDTLFEGMPEDEAMLWPERFLAAIKPGANLEKVKAPFLIFVLKAALKSFDHKKSPDCKKVIDDVIALWKRADATPLEFVAAAWAAAKAAAKAAAWAAKAAAKAAECIKFADKLIELLEAA